MAKIQADSNNVEVGFAKILADVAKKSGIEDDLKCAMPDREARIVLSLAEYLCSTGGTLKNFENWLLTHSIPYRGRLSETVCSDLFTAIGKNKAWILEYLDRSASRLSKEPSLALDLTISHQRFPTDTEALFGSYEEAEQRPTTRLCVLFSEKDRVPIAYTKRPGTIHDVISLESSLTQLNAICEVDPLVVTDCGFVSESNLIDLMGAHLKFLSLVSLDRLWIRETVDQVLPRLGAFSTIYPKNPAINGAAITRKVNFKFSSSVSEAPKKEVKGDLYLYVYRDENVRSLGMKQLYENIKTTMAEWKKGNKYFDGPRRTFFERFFKVSKKGKAGKTQITVNEYAYRQATDFMGVFVLASNIPMDVFEALELYELRGKSGRWFSFDKIQMNSRSGRIYDKEWLIGGRFVQYVALSLYCFFLKELEQVEKALKQKGKNATPAEAKLKLRVESWLKEFSM